MDSSAKKAFQSSSQFNCLRISEKEGGEESGELRLYWEVKTVFKHSRFWYVSVATKRMSLRLKQNFTW